MLGLIPGFNQFPKIQINLYNSPLYSRYIKNKPLQDVYQRNSNNEKQLIFASNDSISGEVELNLSEYNIDSFEHGGLRIELIGSILISNKQQIDIIHFSKDLDNAGILTKDTSYGFTFKEIELPYESYNGTSVKIVYYLKATLTKPFLSLKSTEEVKIKVVILPNEECKVLFNPKIINELEYGNECNIISEITNSKVNINSSIDGYIKFITSPIKMKCSFIELVRREIIKGNK